MIPTTIGPGRAAALLLAVWVGACSEPVRRVEPQPADVNLLGDLQAPGERLPLEVTVFFPPGTEDVTITKPPYRFPVGEAMTSALREASYVVFSEPGSRAATARQRLSLHFELQTARIDYVEALFAEDQLQCQVEVRATIRDAGGEAVWSKQFSSTATGPLAEAGQKRKERPLALYQAIHDVTRQFVETSSAARPLLALVPPELQFEATLDDGDGDGILEARENVVVSVRVRNAGRQVAQDLEVQLSGSQWLLERLGTRRGIGTLHPSKTRSVSFETVLPSEMPTDRSLIQVELSGSDVPLTLVDVFDQRVQQEERPVVAGDAVIEFSSSTIDGNRNGVFEGGERVGIVVEVRNTGEGYAENVEVAVQGDERKLLDAIGANGTPKSLGRIRPGAVQTVSFDGDLPNTVSLGRAAFEIEVRERFSTGKKKVAVEVVPKLDVPVQDEAYAVVVGIEKYRDVDGVDFAARDATTFHSYVTNVLGYPRENTLLLLNDRATKGDLTKALHSWLPNRVTSRSNVLFYFAGHGAPNYGRGDGGKALEPDSYLVPYDGDPNYLGRTGYPVEELYRRLGELRARNAVVLLDSCFSGTGGRSVRAAGTRPIRLVTEEPSDGETPADTSGEEDGTSAGTAGSEGNPLEVAASEDGKRSVITLSAAKKDQISTSHPDSRHGLFTYYVLEGLQGRADLDRDGWVEIAELYEYVVPKVERTARLVNLEQTPTLAPTPLGERGSLQLVPVQE